MIEASNELGARYSQGKENAAKEEKLIQENIRSFLSPADQFAARMIKASQIANNESKKQNDLFVDSSNVNLIENGGVRAS
jgi:hypothetical protein